MRHTPCGCAPYGVLLLNSKARISESKVLVLTVYQGRLSAARVQALPQFTTACYPIFTIRRTP